MFFFLILLQLTGAEFKDESGFEIVFDANMCQK